MALLCNFIVPIDCDICSEQIIIEPCTNSVINFQVGLIPSTQLYLFITDKFKNVWRDKIKVKSDGSIDLALNNYPLGIFNKHSGFFKIFLSTDNQGTNIINLTINNNIYLCIIFGFCYASFP